MTAPARSFGPPLEVIVEGLTARVEEIARSLAPVGERSGRDWVALNPTRADRHLGSFRICIAGPKAGVWKDHATGDGGDVLDLVAYLKFRGEKGPAIRWAADLLGLTGASPQRLAQVAREAELAAAKRKKEAEESAAAKKKAAKAIFFYQSMPEIRDTPADLYLKGRGIDLARLGRQPGCLRFCAALRHDETWDHERRSGPTYPALVAAIAKDGEGCIAIHRTWLEPDRRGGFRKLSTVRDAKMTLGLYSGGTIRLWRGEEATGKPGRGWGEMSARTEPGAEPIAVSEGIEDGLTAACADPSMRVVAAVSIGNMLAIEWPAAIGTITWLDQNDEHPATIRQKAQVVSAWQAQGKRVRRVLPPAGVKDLNDLRTRGEG